LLKSDFWKGDLWRSIRVLTVYNIITGSKFIILMSKKQFLALKKLRTVKKSKMYVLLAQGREEISQKFQRI
jgi:hypothetical protein